ncbi:MAG: FMN-binding protein [Proteobacteria bacterium]|nr:FMN-binding protein [Desulfobacula sp.]MBU3952469.1 FMN-binding protein [Pseudomonadota bacterium]MBU4132846.1 FMN-binding protein [Pseudomonadota bacterium]
MRSFKESNLFQAWLVLLLATAFGAALAGIQTKLGPVIEANKTRETLAKIPALVLGEDPAAALASQKKSLSITLRTIEIERNGVKKFYTVYDAFFEDGTLAGYVAKASGQGYADKIELLLGLDTEGKTITGLFILDQKETPGLGNRIIEKPWRDQFLDQASATRLVVGKGNPGKANEIDAISGATISSRSVTGIVNNTITDIKAQLVIPPKEAAEKPAPPGNETGKIKENT